MFGEIIGAISNFMYSYLLIIMLIGVGLYYTLRTRLVQVRMFKETIRVILEKPVESGAVSSFQALMVSTASRVGTGNIIGISTAICLGGYGAVFWMWVIAVVGGASAFIKAPWHRFTRNVVRTAATAALHTTSKLLWAAAAWQCSLLWL